MVKTKKEKPLTLDVLAKYTHEVIFPYMKDNFAGKETTDKVLATQDKIIGKLDLLLTEKPIKDDQDKRKTKVLKVHNDALKRNQILSEQENLQIDQLGAF